MNTEYRRRKIGQWSALNTFEREGLGTIFLECGDLGCTPKSMLTATWKKSQSSDIVLVYVSINKYIFFKFMNTE